MERRKEVSRNFTKQFSRFTARVLYQQPTFRTTCLCSMTFLDTLCLFEYSARLGTRIIYDDPLRIWTIPPPPLNPSARDTLLSYQRYHFSLTSHITIYHSLLWLIDTLNRFACCFLDVFSLFLHIEYTTLSFWTC